MKKSKNVLMAEQIVATLLRDYTEDEILEKARAYADNFRFAIAQRVTTAIWLITLWDYYEDFTTEDLKTMYEQYLKYHESYNAGNENVYSQMLEVNKLLDGQLLTEKICDAIGVLDDGKDSNIN